jgi:hypothetical protein
MKQFFIILIVFVYCPCFSQDFNKSDIVGEWKVIRSELYISNTLIKAIYLKENDGILDTMVLGQNMGELDEKFNSTVKSLVGSLLIFKGDNSCSWKVKIEDLGFTDEYWVLINSSNQIKICEPENKEKLIPLIMDFTIIKMEKDKLFLSSEDSGGELRFDCLKLK